MKKAYKKRVHTQHGDELKYEPPDIIEATKLGIIEDVVEAINHDPDAVLAVDHAEMSALHWAAATGKYRISDILFQQKLIKKIQYEQDMNGLEPMQHALSSASQKTIDLFFRKLYPEFIGKEVDPYESGSRVVPLHPPFDPE